MPRLSRFLACLACMAFLPSPQPSRHRGYLGFRYPAQHGQTSQRLIQSVCYAGKYSQIYEWLYGDNQQWTDGKL
jgi:hypothetical protein